MSVMVGLVITYWELEIHNCITRKTWQYGQNQCACVIKHDFPIARRIMGKSTFFEIYPDQI